MVVVKNLMIEKDEMILVLAQAENCVLIFDSCGTRRLDCSNL